VDRVHGSGSRKRTAEIIPIQNGRPRSSGPRRLTGEGDDDVSDDVTTGGGGSAARARMLAGERRHGDANGEHQDVEDDAANSPVTKGTAEGQRTAPATRKKRRQPSGQRRRRCSGGLRWRRRSGRGWRRLDDHDGGLPERRRRLERRRRTAGAAATTAARGGTALGRYRRLETKARVAASRGELGGPFKGASERRRRPTATGDEKETSGKTNPKQTRILLFPKEIDRSFYKRKGRGDRGDYFPSIDFTGEGKERPDLEGDGGSAALRFRAAAARGGRQA
jgi:hypothetical protein